MIVNCEFDLICSQKCFDIHRVPFNEILNEMRMFIKVLKNVKSSGQDSYPYSYLYAHSFSVLIQILEEYFLEHKSHD